MKKLALCAYRNAERIKNLFEREGFSVLSTPIVATVEASADTLSPSVLKAVHEGIDWAIFTTGMGMEMLGKIAKGLGLWEKLLNKLKDACVAVRGYKAKNVVVRWNVRVDVEGESVEELMEQLNRYEFGGRKVLLQLYGSRNFYLENFFLHRGAVLDVFLPYLYTENEQAMEKLIRAILEGEIDAVVFTSAYQVDYLLDYSRKVGSYEAVACSLNTKVMPIAMGKVTAKHLRKAGLRAWAPTTGRIGALVKELKKHRFEEV